VNSLPQLKESKGAKRLHKRVTKMISTLDNLVNKLPPDQTPDDKKDIPAQSESTKSQNPPEAKP